MYLKLMSRISKLVLLLGAVSQGSDLLETVSALPYIGVGIVDVDDLLNSLSIDQKIHYENRKEMKRVKNFVIFVQNARS